MLKGYFHTEPDRSLVDSISSGIRDVGGIHKGTVADRVILSKCRGIRETGTCMMRRIPDVEHLAADRKDVPVFEGDFPL